MENLNIIESVVNIVHELPFVSLDSGLVLDDAGGKLRRSGCGAWGDEKVAQREGAEM
ncbi:MAG: hypothetical protein MR294_10385 [Bacteroidales bacterium]|nr:hypothetical protein [Bacteroidales bacterium]